MKKLNEELFVNVKKGYGKDLKEKFKKLLFDISLAIIKDEYLVSNSEKQIMSKIVDYNEICNKLFVEYEDIIDKFLLIRLRSKIFDIAMCIVNDSYIGEELKKEEELQKLILVIKCISTV